MTAIHAEFEQTERWIVKVDVEKFCRYYAEQRADFDGSDEDFVKDALSEYCLIDIQGDEGDGLVAEEDWNELEVSILGVIPA